VNALGVCHGIFRSLLLRSRGPLCDIRRYARIFLARQSVPRVSMPGARLTSSLSRNASVSATAMRVHRGLTTSYNLTVRAPRPPPRSQPPAARSSRIDGAVSECGIRSDARDIVRAFGVALIALVFIAFAHSGSDARVGPPRSAVSCDPMLPHQDNRDCVSALGRLTISSSPPSSLLVVGSVTLESRREAKRS